MVFSPRTHAIWIFSSETQFILMVLSDSVYGLRSTDASQTRAGERPHVDSDGGDNGVQRYVGGGYMFCLCSEGV
jgi:hypothetical protein